MKLFFYFLRHILKNKCLYNSVRITKIISCFLVFSTLSVFAANNASAETKADINTKAKSGLSVNDNAKNVLSVNQQQQTLKVTGIVVDSKGVGIPGATVRIRGANTGTTTDNNGKFSFNVPSEQTTLRFSFVGYVAQEVIVGKQRSFNIVLQEDQTNLEEIVVVGFGTQKKVNLTGSIATVNAKVLESNPVTNVGQALQGIVAGLNITQSGGTGGELENRPTINIRGIATIGQGSNGSPLILIDGMEGDINAVNPNDIDNISVLKDASASAIYGSRAPFGVILVTTKKGKAGKAQVSYSSNLRSNVPILVPHTVDSWTWANVFNQAAINAGQSPFFTAVHLQAIRDFMDGKLGKNTIVPRPGQPTIWDDGYNGGNDNVDWYSAMYKKSAPSQEHNLSVSGGSDNITYYLSANMMDQTGLMKLGGDSYQRYTGTAKIDGKLSSWATLSYNMRYTREDYVRPAALANNYNADQGRQSWPTLPLYDPNGYLFSSPSPALSMRDGGRDQNQNDWSYHQLKLTLEPIKGWKIFGDLNYKVNDYFRHWDTQLTYNHGVSGNPILYGTSSGVHEEASRTQYVSPNIYTEYSKLLGDHNFKLMVGYQSELNKNRSLSADRSGIIVPGNPVMNITSGTDFTGKVISPSVSGQYQEWATSGYFGRFNYDYKGRYLVDASLRYDGTSRFQSDKRWNYFPSVSVGWNLARENFWKPILPIISEFKLRAAYGQEGNQNTSGLYPTYVTMPFNAANSSWLLGGIKVNTSSAPGLISTTLNWETVASYNYGFDISALKNRLTFSGDYFIRYTNNMIGPAPELPVDLGTGVPTTNNTDLKTYGFDFTAAWQDRLKNGLGYNVRFTLSNSDTKIINYPNPTGLLSTYYSGQQMGEIWGYQTIGIAKTTAEMTAYLATLPNGGQNALGNTWQAGDIMYKDVNGDGKIDGGAGTTTNHGDRVVIGNNLPHYSVGMDISANYKGFDFRAFFQGILKRDYFQGSYYFWGFTNVWGSTIFPQHMDYFRDDPTNIFGLNLNSYYPRASFSGGKNQNTQTRYLLNAAYVRLKNLQLGYTIPQSLTKKIGIQKFRIYVSGENILTFTKLTDIFDPETLDGGSGGNVYPLSKVYSIGLSVNF